jgi:hypothetical protein
MAYTGSGMMEAARTSETSVDNYFTRQYIPKDNSELHTRPRENLISHTETVCFSATSASSVCQTTDGVKLSLNSPSRHTEFSDCSSGPFSCTALYYNSKDCSIFQRTYCSRCLPAQTAEANNVWCFVHVPNEFQRAPEIISG